MTGLSVDGLAGVAARPPSLLLTQSYCSHPLSGAVSSGAETTEVSLKRTLAVTTRTSTGSRTVRAPSVNVPKRMNGLRDGAIRPVQRCDGPRRSVHIGNPR